MWYWCIGGIGVWVCNKNRGVNVNWGWWVDVSC